MNIINTKLSFGGMEWGNIPKKFILHHIEAEGDSWDVYKIHEMHRTEPKFMYAGIGYHYYIRLNGTIYKGRPDNAIGAHCKGNNTNALGIAFEGDYDNRKEMPKEQYNAWAELYSYLVSKYGVQPVYGHKECGSSECPGKYFPLSLCKAPIVNTNKYVLGWNKNSTGWWYCTDPERGYYYTRQNGFKTLPENNSKDAKEQTYMFDLQGYAYSDKWVLENGYWYYFNKDCSLRKDQWLYYKNEWYYLDASGKMVTNSWVCYKSNWYYLNSAGKMISNTTVDGYKINERGEKE